MKFEKLGKEKENVTVRTEPFNFSESNILKHYNNTFGYINEHKPSKLEEYIRKLTEKLLAVTKQEFFHDINGKLSVSFSNAGQGLNFLDPASHTQIAKIGTPSGFKYFQGSLG